MSQHSSILFVTRLEAFRVKNNPNRATVIAVLVPGCFIGQNLKSYMSGLQRCKDHILTLWRIFKDEFLFTKLFFGYLRSK